VVHVYDVRWEEVGGRRFALLDVGFALDDPPVYISELRASHRRMDLATEHLTLFVDGVPMGPTVGAPGQWEGTVTVPADPPRRAFRTVAFEVPEGMGTSLSLLVDAPQGALQVHLKGDEVHPEGGRAMVIDLKTADGRPVPADTAMEIRQGDAVYRVAQSTLGPQWYAPWVDGAFTLRAAAPGSQELVLNVDDAHGTVIRGTLVPEARPGIVGAYAPFVPPVQWQPTIDDVAFALPDVEAITAFVKNLAVFPTDTIMRHPDAVLRRGGGSPIERSEVARVLLANKGLDTGMVCGDLGEDQARAMFGGRETRRLEGLGDWSARLEPWFSWIADETKERWASMGGDLAIGMGPRARFALVPEWCWRQIRTPDGWTDIDIRPGATDTPLPILWRSSLKVAPDVYKVGLVFEAVVRDDAGGFETVEMIRYDSDMPTLSQRGFVLDIMPASDDPGLLRSQLLLVEPGEANGRSGRALRANQVEAVHLVARFVDPVQVSTQQATRVLWQRGQTGANLQQLRSAVSGPFGATEIDQLLPWIQGIYLRDHQFAGAAQLMADHALMGLASRYLADGREPADPAPWLTTLFLEGGQSYRSVSRVRSSEAASAPQAAPGIDAMQLAMADAAAQEWFDGFATPAPSSGWTWIKAQDQLKDVRGLRSQEGPLLHMALRQGMHLGFTDKDRMLWDPQRHVASVGAASVEPWTLFEVQPQSNAEAVWADASLCFGAQAWSRAFGIDLPSGVCPL